MSFSTPNIYLYKATIKKYILHIDVYRCILECRFTHFAPYVVHIETDIILRTLARPSTLDHMVDVQQFIQSHIDRTIYTAVPLLLDFLKRRRANRKVNILEMPSARFIGERVVGAASFINKFFSSVARTQYK